MTWKSKSKAERRVQYWRNEVWESKYLCSDATYNKKAANRAQRRLNRCIVDEELDMLRGTWEIPWKRRKQKSCEPSGSCNWNRRPRRYHRVRQSYPTTSWRAQLYYERRARNLALLRSDDD